MRKYKNLSSKAQITGGVIIVLIILAVAWSFYESEKSASMASSKTATSTVISQAYINSMINLVNSQKGVPVITWAKGSTADPIVPGKQMAVYGYNFTLKSAYIVSMADNTTRFNLSLGTNATSGAPVIGINLPANVPLGRYYLYFVNSIGTSIPFEIPVVAK